MQNSKFSTKAMLFVIVLVHLKKIAFALGFTVTTLVVYAFIRQFLYPDEIPLHGFILALVAGLTVGDMAAMLVKESDNEFQQSDD